MKKKALAFAAMACSVAMLLSACGGSNSNAASGDTAGSNIITAVSYTHLTLPTICSV